MKVDKKFILELNKPLGITKAPFRPVAKRLRLAEEKVLSTLKIYRKQGLLRRFGAMLAHKNIGLKTNVLLAWNVPAKRINSVAAVLADFPQVTHCYLRNSYSFWPYNLYSMVHARNRKACMRLISGIVRKVKIKDFRILFTLREFKKTKSALGGLLK
jgi:DNA-binding Lrp family transcriptional regulator